MTFCPASSGVFKGGAGSELTVAVRVHPCDETGPDSSLEQTVEKPAYRATIEELQSRYTQAALAIQMQQR